MADDDHFEGWIGQLVIEHLWDKWGSGRFFLGGCEFEVPGEDEIRARGYDDEDMETIVLIRRKPDGQWFEVEVEPYARRARKAAPGAAPSLAADPAPPQIDGQLPLPGTEAGHG